MILGMARSQNSFGQGEKLYEEHCSSCHKSSGKGLMRIYPPLIGSEWLQNDSTLISVLLNGLDGPIEVKGKKYKGEMPAFEYLNNAEIANILTFIKQEFGENKKQISENQVAIYRKEK